MEAYLQNSAKQCECNFPSSPPELWNEQYNVSCYAVEKRACEAGTADLAGQNWTFIERGVEKVRVKRPVCVQRRGPEKTTLFLVIAVVRGKGRRRRKL